MTAKIKLNAASDGGSVSLKAPSTTTSNAAVELQLPVADGSAGQFMKTDGSGNLSFDTAAGGGKIVKYVTTEAQSATKTTSGQGNAKIELTSLSITPASSSNKVLILVSASVYVYGSSNAFSGLRIHRGDINSGTNIFNQFGGSAASSNMYTPWAFNVVDTPQTSSAQLYTISIFRSSGNTNYVTTDGQSYTLTLIELEP